MKRKTLLIVDDSAISQFVLQQVFEKDYKIRSVDNGQECLNSVERTPPDLILMDIEMPVLNGIEACRLLREKRISKSIPVIFISMFTSEKIKAACYHVGGNGYFIKPPDLVLLKATIYSLVN